MLTSKERAELRAQANTLEPIVIVGKGGITENLIVQTSDALNARELIKCRVLETALMSAREACDALCEATGAEGIQVVGSKFVLYRKSEKQPKPNPPKKKTVNPVKRGVSSAERRLARNGRKEMRILSRLRFRHRLNGKKLRNGIKPRKNFNFGG